MKVCYKKHTEKHNWNTSAVLHFVVSFFFFSFLLKCGIIIHMDKELTSNNAVLAALLWNNTPKQHIKCKYFKGGSEIKLLV